MDAENVRDLSLQTGLFTRGHVINYIFEVSRLRVMEAWPVEQTYNPECPVNPTSLRLEVEFKEVREDGTATLSVSLKRMDPLDMFVNACVWVQVSDLNETLIIPLWAFEMAYMFPDDELKDTVEVAPFPARRELLNDRVQVHISVMISRCHVLPDPASDSESSHVTSVRGV